jgi:hypothetical protein
MRNGNVYREDRIHVLARMCDTCIFRPGNLMRLRQGRVDGMVKGALKAETAIVCHSTLGHDEAVCRGFYNRHQTLPLKLARALDAISFIEPPKGDHA